jgi:hypothetical protein
MPLHLFDMGLNGLIVRMIRFELVELLHRGLGTCTNRIDLALSNFATHGRRGAPELVEHAGALVGMLLMGGTYPERTHLAEGFGTSVTRTLLRTGGRSHGKPDE